MRTTCLDCHYGNLEIIPQPGHPCLTCEGKTISVKADGSNFRAKSAEDKLISSLDRHKKRFRRLRSDAGLTMGDAARALGCSVVRVYDIELGIAAPTTAEVLFFEGLEVRTTEPSVFEEGK